MKRHRWLEWSERNHDQPMEMIFIKKLSKQSITFNSDENSQKFPHSFQGFFMLLLSSHFFTNAPKLQRDLVWVRSVSIVCACVWLVGAFCVCVCKWERLWWVRVFVWEREEHRQTWHMLNFFGSQEILEIILEWIYPKNLSHTFSQKVAPGQQKIRKIILSYKWINF